MLATSLLPREYIELQLRFATWISHGHAASFPQAVLVATNLFRRFRLGHPDDASISSEWQGYVAELCGCTSLDAQVEWTSTFFAERRQLDAPPLDAARDELVSGPFSAEVIGDALRFHFVPEIGSDDSPLHASQLARRRDELGVLVREVATEHPEVQRVRGGSWLYSTGGYRSLFPPEHVATARVRDDIVRFQGSSSWGSSSITEVASRSTSVVASSTVSALPVRQRRGGRSHCPRCGSNHPSLCSLTTTALNPSMTDSAAESIGQAGVASSPLAGVTRRFLSSARDHCADRFTVCKVRG